MGAFGLQFALTVLATAVAMQMIRGALAGTPEVVALAALGGLQGAFLVWMYQRSRS
jgi:hypothetical protein